MMVRCSSSTHNQPSSGAEWPFRQPRNQVAFTSVHITERHLPILLATHDDDDAWQFHWGGAVTKADMKILCLACMFSLDPSLAELADLPLDWQAERAALDQPWTRTPSEFTGDA